VHLEKNYGTHNKEMSKVKLFKILDTSHNCKILQVGLSILTKIGCLDGTHLNHNQSYKDEKT
jgi:hypothetical protein